MSSTQTQHCMLVFAKATTERFRRMGLQAGTFYVGAGQRSRKRVVAGQSFFGLVACGATAARICNPSVVMMCLHIAHFLCFTNDQCCHLARRLGRCAWIRGALPFCSLVLIIALSRTVVGSEEHAYIVTS
jgi:hypothetical protein